MSELVYLASPYSHPDPRVVFQRWWDTIRAAARLLERGMLVYSPIAHTHHIAATCGLRGDFEFWRRFDEAMIDRCDRCIVLLLPGWMSSKGMEAEVARFEAQGKPIECMEWIP